VRSNICIQWLNHNQAKELKPKPSLARSKLRKKISSFNVLKILRVESHQNITAMLSYSPSYLMLPHLKP